MKRLLILATIVLGSALVLAGCNTIQGAGQDIQNTGKAIHNAAS